MPTFSEFTVFLYMNDNEKESNLHSHSGKNISPSSHISFLSEKKSVSFCMLTLMGAFI